MCEKYARISVTTWPSLFVFCVSVETIKNHILILLSWVWVEIMKMVRTPRCVLLMALGLHQVCAVLFSIGVQDCLSNLSSAVRTTWGTCGLPCIFRKPEVIILLLQLQIFGFIIHPCNKIVKGLQIPLAQDFKTSYGTLVQLWGLKWSLRRCLCIGKAFVF